MDAAGSSISASIRIIDHHSGASVARVSADDMGRFTIGSLSPGEYDVGIFAPGFRRRQVLVAVGPGTRTDLGVLELPGGGCDAPGVSCDFFLTAGMPLPVFKPLVFQGSVRLEPTCTLDLDRRQQASCGGQSSGADLQLVSDAGGLVLLMKNGSRADPTPSNVAECSKSAFDKDRIRLDGLGLGSDFCVRTKGGSVAHVFLTHEIERDTSAVTLWCVVRKR